MHVSSPLHQIERIKKGIKSTMPNAQSKRKKSKVKSSEQPKEKPKIYHPPVDTTREEMMKDLVGIKEEKKVPIIENNEQKNDNIINKDTILEGNYSYSYIANLKRRGEITQDQFLDLKAKKQGFKNHLERVTMRYLEVVKDIKYKQLNNLFKNDFEKNKLFKKMKSMENFLKYKEKEREKEIELMDFNKI